MKYYLAGKKKRENRTSLKRVILFTCLFPFLFLGISLSATAQTKVLINDAFFEIDAKKAIDSLYNRNPDAAEELLEPWMEKYPDHPLWLLWDGMEVWWDVLEDLQDHARDREFVSMMQRADYEAGKVLRSEAGHPDALIIRSVANGYIARFHANQEDWITSVQVGRKAYAAHQELLEVAPNLPDNDFAEGMKLYYAAYIPDAYPVVKAVSWFFPDGDKEEGLKKLEYASSHGVFARPEANYFLANILLNYEKDYEKAKERFKQLVSQYPHNGYYRRQYLRTLAQLDQYSEILIFADNTLKYWQDEHLAEDPVLESEARYWIGRAYYYQRNWQAALPYLEQSVKTCKKLVNSEERDIYALSAYFAGRTHEILNDEKEAKKYYKMAADQKATPGVRKQAKEQLNSL